MLEISSHLFYSSLGLAASNKCDIDIISGSIWSVLQTRTYCNSSLPNYNLSHFGNLSSSHQFVELCLPPGSLSNKSHRERNKTNVKSFQSNSLTMKYA